MKKFKPNQTKSKQIITTDHQEKKKIYKCICICSVEKMMNMRVNAMDVIQSYHTLKATQQTKILWEEENKICINIYK